MTDAKPPFHWRSIILPALLPTALFATGEGALIPIIPVAADGLGATLAVAGLIAAMITVGQLIGDIPSGWLVSRIGERNAMIWGAVLSVIGVLIAIAAPGPLGLGIGILLIGIATAVFSLARHAFMTTFVPVPIRARALSTLGGVFRGGWFLGPFLAAGVITLTGSTQAVFWIHVIACLAVIVILLVLPDPERTFGQMSALREEDGEPISEGEAEAEAESKGLFRTLWANRQVYLSVGSGAALISALRSSRTVVLPLWAVSLGMSEADTALVIGLAGAVDFALFYTSGQVMDRFGRLWAGVPAMIGLGVGHLVLAFTHDLPGAVAWFIAVAVLLGFANGLSSGINMTLGADLASPSNPAPFLGGWRFVSDVGGAASPLLVSAITSLIALPVAVATMGVLGFAGAGILARNVPRYLPGRPRRPRPPGQPGPSGPEEPGSPAE